MAAIPFQRELRFEYGVVEQVAPLIRRVIARNPGPFTLHGTGTYIIGHGEVAVIDPGPALPEHVDALLEALRGETITLDALKSWSSSSIQSYDWTFTDGTNASGARRFGPTSAS